MSDFTLFLPIEIVPYIFSNVSQVDCVECMAVCRRWYKLIPQCVKEVWNELEISKRSWPRFNNAMLKCLGTHVKNASITIHYEDLSEVLRRLEDQGCDIQSLEIRGFYRIYASGLNRGALVFSAGLCRTLKELFLIGRCTHFLSLDTVLSSLPALTHLTFKSVGDPDLRPSDYYDPFTQKITVASLLEKEDIHVNYNLVFLCLHSNHEYYDVKKIINRCPRLKYFLVSSYVTRQFMNPIAIGFLRIFEICPSICYIHWGERDIQSQIETEWLKLSRTRNIDNKDNTSDYEKREPNRVRQVEFCGDTEQQYISALQLSLQQPSLLEHLRLSCRRNIDLCQLWNRFTQRNRNLLLQPSELKSLGFSNFHIPRQTVNDTSFQDLFSYFQNIEQLEMNFLISIHNVENERVYSRKVVEALGHELHKLQYLHLGVTYSNSFQTRPFVFDNLSTTLCNWNQKVEILHLDNVFISKEALLNLCDHPKLHTLNLSGYLLHEQLTRDDWISFARKLKEQEQSCYSSGKIQSILLSCSYCHNVTDEVLEEFADVKSLRTLRIEYNGCITDAGVTKFATTNSCGAKKHRRVELYSCVSVSLDNRNVVFVHSRF